MILRTVQVQLLFQDQANLHNLVRILGNHFRQTASISTFCHLSEVAGTSRSAQPGVALSGVDQTNMLCNECRFRELCCCRSSKYSHVMSVQQSSVLWIMSVTGYVLSVIVENSGEQHCQPESMHRAQQAMHALHAQRGASHNRDST